MPPRDWKFRLHDIIDAIKSARSYVADTDYDTFASDEMMIDAVLRKLTVIGEAAASIPPDVRREVPHVPWAEIVAMRNIVVHHSFGVSLPIIWQTLIEDLDPLTAALEAYLQSVDTER
jgi:uncharacterized protein with HEPN domain